MIWLFLLLFPLSAYAQTYGTFENPGCATCYFNVKLKDGATRANPVVTNGNTIGEYVNKFKWRPHFVWREDPDDPLRQILKDNSNTDGHTYCVASPNYTNVWGSNCSIRIPNDLLIGDINRDNPATFVNDNGFLGKVYFARCTNGGAPVFRFLPSGFTSSGGNCQRTPLSSNLLAFRGETGLQGPIFGGTIRSGELAAAVGVPIPHTLSGTVPPKILHNSGPAWPLSAMDGFASTGYTGSSTLVRMGTLLTLPNGYVCNGLRTEPGKKVCGAIRDYGLQPSDTSAGAQALGGTAWAIHGECGKGCYGLGGGETYYTTPGVYKDLLTYNIDGLAADSIVTCPNITSISSAASALGATVIATRNWCEDLEDISNNFRVVTNNLQISQKGVENPKFVSATFVVGSGQTETDVVLASPDLALQAASACTAWVIKDDGVIVDVFTCQLQGGSQVRLTHEEVTGVGTVGYTEVGSGTARVRTIADTLVNGSSGTEHELVGFVNQPIDGGGSSTPPAALTCYAYTNGPPTANDTDTALWTPVNGTGLNATNLVGGVAWDGSNAEVRCLHDATHLWLFARSTDSQSCPPTPDGPPFKQDTFEFFVDKNNDAGAVGQVDNMQVWSLSTAPYWEEGISSGHTVTNAIWFTSGGSRYAKMQIPWSTLGGAPSVGTLFGFDLRIPNGDTPCDNVNEGTMSLAIDAQGGNFTGLTTAILLNTVVDLTPTGNAPPVIINFAFTNVTTTAATLTLTTNEAATCLANWEIDPGESPWDNQEGPTASGTTHQFNFTGLSAATAYDIEGICNDGNSDSDPVLLSVTTSGTTLSTVRQSHFQFFNPGSPFSFTSPASMTALATVDTAAAVMSGGVVAWRVQNTCDGGAADCSEIGVVPYCSMDGGSYTLVPDSCASSDICFWTSYMGVTSGQTFLETPTERLSDTYPNRMGQVFTRQTVALVGGSNSDDTEQEVLYYLQVAPNASATTIDCRLQLDGGGLLSGGYQAETARINVVSPKFIRLGF